MKTAALSPERLNDLIRGFPGARIAVLGDFFLDKYLEVDPGLEEISLETAKVAHQVVGIRCSPGAAGTVVSNLAALGAGELHAIGFTGMDGEGFDLRHALRDLGCGTENLHEVADRRTPTYLKPRDARDSSLAGEHSRYDTKNRDRTTVDLEAKIIASLDALLPAVDAVVILDQVEERDCGVVTKSVREALRDRAGRFPGVRFWADSRRRIHEFRAVTIKANQFEAIGKENPAPDDEVDLAELRTAVGELRTRNGAPVVVTRGARGMVVSDPEWVRVPGVAVAGEIDPTGAGDSVTAGTVLALCAGADLPEAAVIGNLVGSITIQQIGTTGVARPDELPARLELWEHGR